MSTNNTQKKSSKVSKSSKPDPDELDKRLKRALENDEQEDPEEGEGIIFLRCVSKNLTELESQQPVKKSKHKEHTRGRTTKREGTLSFFFYTAFW